MLGIVLMIVANELTFNHLDERTTMSSWFIKLIITISTAMLLALLIYYHYLDLKLYSNQNALRYHLVGLTKKKMCLIIIELIVCAIHPFPRSYPHIATDVGLGLPSKYLLFVTPKILFLLD